MHMHDTGTIRYLSCNGTNGTNAGPKNDSNTGDETNNPTTSSASPGGLTAAASAGIGVGVGAAVLGIIAVLVWFILRYRRKLRGLAEASNNNGRADPKEATSEKPKSQETLLDGTQAAAWSWLHAYVCHIGTLLQQKIIRSIYGPQTTCSQTYTLWAPRPVLSTSYTAIRRGSELSLKQLTSSRHGWDG